MTSFSGKRGVEGISYKVMACLACGKRRIWAVRLNHWRWQMPLKKSSTKKAFVSNLKEELKTKPRAQALAIAYSEAGEKKKKKRK